VPPLTVTALTLIIITITAFGATQLADTVRLAGDRLLHGKQTATYYPQHAGKWWYQPAASLDAMEKNLRSRWVCLMMFISPLSYQNKL